jgi:hypothetical protein
VGRTQTTLEADAARKRRNRRHLAIALALVVALGAAAALVFYRTFSTQGEAAIAAMTDADRRWLAKVETLHGRMGYAEVATLLGEPDREDIAGLRPTWEVDGSPLNQIAVYFWDGRAVKVRWIKVGYFVYEKVLR